MAHVAVCRLPDRGSRRGVVGLSLTAPRSECPSAEWSRISFCSLPLSPTAFRRQLMRLSSVESDTIRRARQVNEVVLLTDAIAMFQQMNQPVEHLRLHGDECAVPVQLAPVVRECAVEAEFHVAFIDLFSRNNQVRSHEEIKRQAKYVIAVPAF